MSSTVMYVMSAFGGLVLGLVIAVFAFMGAEKIGLKKQGDKLLEEKQELENRQKLLQDLEKFNEEYHVFFETHKIPVGAEENPYILLHQANMKLWKNAELERKFSMMELYVDAVYKKYIDLREDLKKHKDTFVSMQWAQKMVEVEHNVKVSRESMGKMTHNISNYERFDAVQRSKFLAELEALAWVWASDEPFQQLSHDIACA